MSTVTKLALVLEASGGGAAKHVSLLANAFSEQGMEVHLVTSLERASDSFLAELEKLRNTGVIVHSLPMKRDFDMFMDVRAIRQLSRLMKTEAFDIVHAHSTKAGFLLRLAVLLAGPQQVVYTPHCFYFAGLSGWKRWIVARMEKTLAALTDRIILVSKNEMELAKRYAIGSDQKRVLIWNGIEPASIVEDNRLRKSLNLPEGAQLVVGAGRLSVQKNWPFFITQSSTILARHPNAFFLLVGEGEEETSCRSLIRQQEMGAHLKLVTPADDIEQYLQLASVVANVSSWEGLSYVLLEAMQLGKPLVVSRVGGNPEAVKHGGNGLLFDLQSPEEFVEAVSTILANSELASQMGESGKQMIRSHFLLDSWIEKHLVVYQALLDTLSKAD